jgi:diaminopimelate decarboxylase
VGIDPDRLTAAADRFGTPAYVYDASRIRELATRLLSHLPPNRSKAFFSAKANSAVGMAALMRELGFGLDACSPGDLRLGELAGYKPAEISYTSFGATDAELSKAARAAGDLVIDSVQELERLSELEIVRPIGLRVNPAIEAGFHSHVAAGAASAKFGIPYAQLHEACARATDLGIPVTGLHGHIGSDVLDPAAHILLLDLLVDAALQLPDVRWINIGGGFGTPRDPTGQRYAWPELARAWERAERRLGGRAVELRVEPGGHLLMDTGYLLAGVTRVAPACGTKLATISTDASTNHLPSILLYDAAHDVQLVGPRPSTAGSAYRVVGNLMQAADVLAERAELPIVQPGDLLTFSHAGAYAASRATTFNERPRPAEVLLDGGDVRLLRAPESLDDLFARDCLPANERPRGD